MAVTRGDPPQSQCIMDGCLQVEVLVFRVGVGGPSEQLHVPARIA
eukprot:CAMPEP_0206172710 /NCGR_PEP_ID=MMETSP1474-20131121/46473_1 /ASSEMBLY_ACC=CAM_ASM_001110 /TAXON_ID=97495 /ORGANISM="Imantonia sp., Strain RCC918" /LENGTH=44 /DNA_ID= /DNA_START= /DNA_END= /DNA_ORIENTATION=